MSKQISEAGSEEKDASHVNILRARAGDIQWGRQGTTEVILYTEYGEKDGTSVVCLSIGIVPEKVRKE